MTDYIGLTYPFSLKFARAGALFALSARRGLGARHEPHGTSALIVHCEGPDSIVTHVVVGLDAFHEYLPHVVRS